MPILRRATAPLVALALSACATPSGTLIELHPYEASVRVGVQPPITLEAALADPPRMDRQRVARIAKQFASVGCRRPYLRLAEVAGSGLPNVICVLPGRSDDMIVVGAHLDRPRGGHGIVDNWTGLALLPELYRSLAVVQREHTYVFVGFADAKPDLAHDWLIGSRHFVKRLPGERLARVRAMINLMGVGMRAPAVQEHQADPNLLLDLQSVGLSLGEVVRGANILRPLHDDARSFRLAGVPSLMIHSFDRRTVEILEEGHHDYRPELVDLRAYYTTYRLLGVYLGYLDGSLAARRALAANS